MHGRIVSNIGVTTPNVMRKTVWELPIGKKIINELGRQGRGDGEQNRKKLYALESSTLISPLEVILLIQTTLLTTETIFINCQINQF